MLSWSVLHGCKEYNYFHENRELINSLNHPADKQYSYFSLASLEQRRGFAKELFKLASSRFAAWLNTHGSFEHRLPD